MNYWKHSLLSKKKFGGIPEDYLTLHKFLDSSKLFYYHTKHRLLLHNTYGIDLCVQKFGVTLLNSDSKTILVRDIAAEHCKEDLCGVVPTLNNWFKFTDASLTERLQPFRSCNMVLEEFVLRPYVFSGLSASLLITQSNFGIYLVKEFLGIDAAMELAEHLEGNSVSELLQAVSLRERWQYAPSPQQLKELKDDEFSNEVA